MQLSSIASVSSASITPIKAVESLKDEADTSSMRSPLVEYRTRRSPRCRSGVGPFGLLAEYKSVRLYIHNTGPKFALYILEEPKSWQSIETGGEKFLAATEVMSQSFMWGRHTDNVACRFGDSPPEIMGGVTASKGDVNFWDRLAAMPPANENLIMEGAVGPPLDVEHLAAARTTPTCSSGNPRSTAQTLSASRHGLG